MESSRYGKIGYMRCPRCKGEEFEVVKCPDSLRKRFPSILLIRICVECGLTASVFVNNTLVKEREKDEEK